MLAVPPDQVLFAHVVGKPDAQIELDVAALLVGEWEYASLDVAHYLSLLDGFAEAARALVAGEQGPHREVRALNRALFDRLGFRGNQDAYYDPRNSFLNEVIDRRTGIPITLSVLYLEVGRRLGLEMVGLNFPGHFLCRYDGDGDTLVLDPFHMGLTVGTDDLRDRLRQASGASATLGPDHLKPAGKREILTRMLGNLAAIYRQNGDTLRSIEVLARMVILNPENPRMQRELAQLRQLAGDLN